MPQRNTLPPLHHERWSRYAWGAQALYIARTEFGFFTRFPKLLWATLAVAIIPALYVVIYLSSVWDPAGRTQDLAVGLVNHDAGLQYRDHRFNVGDEVVRTLRTQAQFGYRDFNNEEDVRQRVRQGELAFALIIPQDFSSNALPGAQPGGGKLVVYTSEGNSFEGAAIARHFAQELGNRVNESINERRWALVLRDAAGSQRSVDRLRAGVAELHQGAQELDLGTQQITRGTKTLQGGSRALSDGVGQLTTGVKQLGNGLRALDAKRPSNTDLTRIKNGAEALASGHDELSQGMEGLLTGSQRLQKGIDTLRDEARDSLFIPSRVADGAGQLSDGMGQLDSGLQSANTAQQKLADGANKLSAGVSTLTTGVRTMGNGIHSAVSKLPEDHQLDALAVGATDLTRGVSALVNGTDKLGQGSHRLLAGLELLAVSLPANIDAPQGSAQGLANSVTPQLEVVAPVQNNGSGFAANVIPGALWLGAGIAAFLIHVRTLPRQARHFSAPARTLGKLMLPLAVVWLQAALVWGTVHWGLHIHIAHPASFALALWAASGTFLLIVFALTRALGDAGKALAMVFLAVQLSASGGVLPVELSGGMYEEISPWLPMTWVVRAIKATLFGAYDAAWQGPLTYLAVAALLASLLACYVGRWRYVPHSAMRPAVDF
jgi:putative membrane protein